MDWQDFHLSFFFNVFISLMLLYISEKVFGVGFKDILSIVRTEIRDLVKLNWNRGAINALGMLLLFIFGLMYVVSERFSEVFALVEETHTETSRLPAVYPIMLLLSIFAILSARMCK